MSSCLKPQVLLLAEDAHLRSILLPNKAAPHHGRSLGPGTLIVLDLFSRGDRFEVFDNLVSIGQTSVVVNDGLSTCSNNIGNCLADLTYSRLIANIAGAGAHSITINVLQNALGTFSGAAVFQLASPGIPEPGTLGLLAGGLALLALRRFRK